MKQEDLSKITILPDKLEAVKASAEQYYKEIKDVYCPYLQEKVVFNAHGIEHLKFKGRNKARSNADQYVRLRLLRLAPVIIQKSHTLQERYECKRFETMKIGKKWETKMIEVTYYTFIAILNEARMKVVIKQIGNSSKFFWSLIPFWRVDSKNSGSKKIFHSGNLEED
jgi:hypothetical protein